MKRNLLPLTLALLLLSSPTSLIFAQASSNDWAVVQRLNTNERLVVRQKNGKEFKGRMIEASDTALTIDQDGKPVNIARSEVRQVYVIAGKAEKGKWALIGAGIGAGAGAGIGAAKYSNTVDDSQIWIPMGLIIGTGTGALSGLLFGQSNRKRTMVYDAR